MNKIDQLFIRACKSKNPHKRLKSISRRFYVYNDTDEDKYIIIKLAELCDKYLPIKATHIIADLTDSIIMRDATIQEKLFRIFLNNIRFAEISAFPELTPPAMFRNKP